MEHAQTMKLASRKVQRTGWGTGAAYFQPTKIHSVENLKYHKQYTFQSHSFLAVYSVCCICLFKYIILLTFS